MKLITAIEKQKRTKDRYNVYLDHVFAFSCNEELVVKLKLNSGKNIDEDELSRIIQEDNLKEAFNKALGHLTSRSRTNQEVINFLTTKGFDEEVINKTIDRLKGYQFINDEKYTSNFVKNKSQSQLKGKGLIQRELSHKGVEDEVIEEGLSTYTPEEELENAIKIGKQYFYSKKSLPLNQIKQKLSNKLIGKGYSWDIISKCIQALEQEPELQEMMEDQQDVHFQEAVKLAEKYYSKHSKKEANSYLLKKKVGAHLYQKGFDQTLIQRILEETPFQ